MKSLKKTFYLCSVLLTIFFICHSTSFASEASRNKEVQRKCEEKASGYSDGDGQTTPHCQQAIVNQCLADNLGQYYPDAKSTWKSRVSASCQILNKMGANCPVCN